MASNGLSKEEENYIRIALLLTGVSPRAVRVLFDKEFPPASLSLTLNDKKVKNKLNDLRGKRVLNKAQWDLLFPTSGITDSKTFDVTLMIALLRNFTTLVPPTNGYDQLPAENEISPASDLARIKLYRNFLAHLQEGKIDCSCFDTAWKNISEAVQRLGGNAMKQECFQLHITPLDMSVNEILRDLRQAKCEIEIIKRSLDKIENDLIQADHIEVKADINTLYLYQDSLNKSCELLHEHQRESKKDTQKLRADNAYCQQLYNVFQGEYKKNIDELKTDHKYLHNYCTLFEEQQKDSKKDISNLKSGHATLQKLFDLIQKDTVPWNRRVYIKAELKQWETDTDNYIETGTVKHVLGCVRENSCVTIIASSGVGKTTTLRQVALEMAKEGYDILPLTDPKEIVQFCNPNHKTLFVIDDFCGTYSLNQPYLDSWEPVMEQIKERITNKFTKLIVACRLQVYKDEKFESLTIFRKCVCNLSESLCLSKKEKKSIAELYLKTKASEITEYYDLYDCFPLLCKLFSVNPVLNITDFFQNPFSVYEAEIDNLHKKGHSKKYCALALCVMFDNKIEEKWLTDEIDAETRRIIENTCEACRLERGTSRLIILDEIRSLEHTFIRKDQNVYKTLHDKIFDFLTYYFGGKMIKCLIRNAVSRVIMERFVLNKQDETNQFSIVVPRDCHQMYIQRMIDDWSKGRVKYVFNNNNMKLPSFRYKFLNYLNTLDILFQKKLAMTCDADDNSTVLSESCILGDLSLIEWCFYHGVDVNMCNFFGMSALVLSAYTGNTEIVKILLDRNADINLSTHNGESPLLVACSMNHVDIAKVLLDNKADINKSNDYGSFPLFTACGSNHIKIVQLLLNNNADINKHIDDGASSLFYACQENHIEVVTMLLNNKADVDKCRQNGVSPLLIACKNNNLEVVKLLLHNKADINKSNDGGSFPLFTACGSNHIKIVQLLLNNNADINKHIDDGASSLFYACQENHIEVVTMLLNNKADVDKCRQNGVSPLLIACKNNNLEVVKLLLHNKADINKSNDGGSFPLFIACGSNHMKIVQLLLDNNADINKQKDDGASSLFYACQENHIEVVTMLLNNKADVDKCRKNGASPLLIACKNNNLEVVKLLLHNKADINKSNDGGSFPLFIACGSNHMKIVQLLLDNNADINKQKDDGASSLFYACQENHIEVVTMLLNNKADVDKCRKNGASPLLIACEKNNLEVVKLLLHNKSDINKCNDAGASPLLIACWNNNEEIVKILLDNKADINKGTDNSYFPLFIACQKNHIEITKLLLENNADIDKFDALRVTPLLSACLANNLQIIELLLINDANVNISTYWGISPLLAAVMNKQIDIVRKLMRKGASLDKIPSLFWVVCYAFGLPLKAYMDEHLD